MLDYNVPGGKLNRGMAVADVLAAVKSNQVQHGHWLSCQLLDAQLTLTRTALLH